jgi:hypothetical protein
MRPEGIHDMTWRWMMDAHADLKRIASEAKKASKEAPSLNEKVAMRRVERQAANASMAVLKLFGGSGEAGADRDPRRPRRRRR